MDRRPKRPSSIGLNAVEATKLFHEPVVDDHQETRAVRSKSCLPPTKIFGELPSDMLIPIFSRLPIKSVLRCKAVCKKWCKIIKDPYFTRFYSKNSPFRTLLISGWSDVHKHTIKLCLVEICENGDCIKTPFSQPLPKSIFYLNADHSCDGLLRTATCKKEGLLNPIVGNGPDFVMSTLPAQDYKDETFYYCSSVNKFKVLKLFPRQQSRDHPYHYKVEAKIFTVRVDEEWRCLPDVVFEYHSNHHPATSTGVVLNGIHHWSPSCDACDIYTVDLEEEKQGRVMSQPNYTPHQTTSYGRRLVVLNDQLSIHEGFSHKRTIWIMKEYGVAESWTRIDINENTIIDDLNGLFPPTSPEFSPLLFYDSDGCSSPIPSLYDGYICLSPAAMLENGVIVLIAHSRDDKLVFYDPTLRVVTKVEDLENKNHRSSINAYTPCFLPLREVMKTM